MDQQAYGRMLKKSASFFSLRSDPQRGPSRLTNSAARTDVVLLIRRTVRPRGYASGLLSLRPCPRNGASRRAGVGRVRRLAFLSILRWFPRSLLAVRDPFLTVRLFKMIDDVVGFRQHNVSILKDWDIILA